MREYYPLTAAQKMHHDWIKKYRTQQVSGVSVVASLQAPLDFGLLKKCLQLEFERYGCMRIRFTKPDENGDVEQYIVKKETRDIPFKDLSGMSLAQADQLMQQWAYETFEGDNIPMCDVTMVKLPEGYNGFFIHMDHRLIDSCGLVVMINDLMQLYTHYKYPGACRPGGGKEAARKQGLKGGGHRAEESFRAGEGLLSGAGAHKESDRLLHEPSAFHDEPAAPGHPHLPFQGK